jgi:hypothetical protein
MKPLNNETPNDVTFLKLPSTANVRTFSQYNRAGTCISLQIDLELLTFGVPNVLLCAVCCYRLSMIDQSVSALKPLLGTLKEVMQRDILQR